MEFALALEKTEEGLLKWRSLDSMWTDADKCLLARGFAEVIQSGELEDKLSASRCKQTKPR